MSNVPQKIPDKERKRVKIDHGFRAWYESCPCCLVRPTRKSSARSTMST
jgi:hypothetical protein